LHLVGYLHRCAVGDLGLAGCSGASDVRYLQQLHEGIPVFSKPRKISTSQNGVIV